MSSADRGWNARLKGRAGWIAIGLLAVVALAVGALRSTGPLTDEDRADAIAQDLACPVCDGESVYESQSPAAIGIRNQITSLVQQGTYSDDEIVAYLEEQFGTQTQLVPKGSGIEALVWAVPVVGLVAAVVGLAMAFRRWRLAGAVVPTDADRELVEAAMRDERERSDA